MKYLEVDVLQEARELLARTPLAANGALIARLCDEVERLRNALEYEYEVQAGEDL